MLSGQKSNPKRILAIASGGGHWVQLLRLQTAFAGCDVTFASVRASYAEDVPGQHFVTIPDATRWNRLKLLHMALRIAWLIAWLRPNAIVSTGAAPGYVAVRLGKMIGARTIWLDSIANVEEVSLAGQKVGAHADLWLTQWEHLVRPEGPQYKGAVL